MNEKKIENHIKHLKEQHNKADNELNTLKASFVDDLTITRIKKTKLALKDQITKFKNMLKS